MFDYRQVDEAPAEIRALFHEHDAAVIRDAFKMAGIRWDRKAARWSGVEKAPDALKFIEAEYERRYRNYETQGQAAQ